MDTRQGIGLVLLSIVAAVVGGCAHGSGIEFGAFGSYLDSDDLGDGYGSGAKLEVNPIDLVSIDGRAGWIHFDDADLNMFPLELAGLVNLPLLGEQIVPYAGAGVGYYFFDGDRIDLDDEVGFFPLVGLEIGLHPISLLAEARWLFLEADVDSAKGEFANLREADIDGLGINLGLLIRF